MPGPFVRPRLAGMMFLFYFAVGSWIVTLSTYLMSAPTAGGLNFTTSQVGWVYSTFAFGGMLAPLVVGLLADRLFRAERVLGVCGVVCCGLLVAAARWCDGHFPEADQAYRTAAAREDVAGRPVPDVAAELDPATAVAGPGVAPLRRDVRDALDRVNDDPGVRAAASDTFGPLFGLMLAYCLAMQIGLTLTTVIAFRHLPDARRGFGFVRVFGTVGWIVAGLALGAFLAPRSPGPLYQAAAASGLVGLYAFTLPATPPRGTGRSVAEALGLPALRLFRDRSFGVFVGCAVAATGLNQFYVVYCHRYLTDLGLPKPEQVMTLGQVCEVGCMVLVPFLDPRRWMKPLMAVGLAGYVLRGAALASGSDWAAVALGVPMHGWSYTFFYIVAAGYLDREAPPHLRASAQGILTFVSSGLGVWAGNLAAGWVVDANRAGTAIDWPPVWTVPLVGSTLALVAFVALFKPPPDPDPPRTQP